MIRRGSLKYVHCPADPDQLFDIETDPNELQNLATDPNFAAQLQAMQKEVSQRWNMEGLQSEVLVDQRRRRLIDNAMRAGEFTPWDYTPPRNAAGEYMRNHLDLNEVERSARWPR
jgi:choline-sulfatase